MSLELGGSFAVPRPGQNPLVAMLPSARHPKHTEDAFFIDRLQSLGAVVDGMGGHDSGDLAASVGRDAISRVAYLRTREGLDWPLFALTTARSAVVQRKELEGNNMGATAVAAAVELGVASVAWCGDARAYGVTSGGDLAILTRDHGLIDLWRRFNRITPAQAQRLEEILDIAAGERAAEKLGDEIEGLSQLLTRDREMVRWWVKDSYIEPREAEQLVAMLQHADDPEMERSICGKIAGVAFRNRSRVSSELSDPGSPIEHLVVPTDGLIAVVLMSDGIPDNLIPTKISEVVANHSHDLNSLAGALVEAARTVSESGSGRAKRDDMTALVLPVTRRQLPASRG